MKPENIFLVREPNDNVFPKLLDFGVSRSTERNAGHTITREGIVMGTPEYVSPEQARGRMADVRSDIYSLGVVMYEALAGRLPFQADNAADLIVAVLNSVPIPLVSLRDDLGDALGAFVGKAMARSPDDRFQSAEEMRLALLEVIDSEPHLQALSLPKRFVTPQSQPSDAELDRVSLDPLGAPTLAAPSSGESIRPTAALPALFEPVRKRALALGAGALGLVLALAALAFITTGGEPSPAARAESGPEPVVPAAPPKPALSREISVELRGLPQGAHVRVDGREVSENPLKLVRGSGEHQITIEATGMQLWSVMHDAYEDGRYAVSLEPDPALQPKAKPGRKKKSRSGLLARPDF
jgi:serine/threonine-protein kinase